jgi:hypothetical protein
MLKTIQNLFENSTGGGPKVVSGPFNPENLSFGPK